MSASDFKCVFCHSEVKPATTRLIPPGEDAPIMIFTGVPCEKCVHCGYEYMRPATTRKLVEQARAAIGTIQSQNVRPIQAKLISFQA